MADDSHNFHRAIYLSSREFVFRWLLVGVVLCTAATWLDYMWSAEDPATPMANALVTIIVFYLPLFAPIIAFIVATTPPPEALTTEKAIDVLMQRVRFAKTLIVLFGVIAPFAISLAGADAVYNGLGRIQGVLQGIVVGLLVFLFGAVAQSVQQALAVDIKPQNGQT